MKIIYNRLLKKISNKQLKILMKIKYKRTLMISLKCKNFRIINLKINSAMKLPKIMSKIFINSLLKFNKKSKLNQIRR